MIYECYLVAELRERDRAAGAGKRRDETRVK